MIGTPSCIHTEKRHHAPINFREPQRFYVCTYSIGQMLIFMDLHSQIMFLLAFSFANFENWGVPFCKWKSRVETFLGSVSWICHFRLDLNFWYIYSGFEQIYRDLLILWNTSNISTDFNVVPRCSTIELNPPWTEGSYLLDKHNWEHLPVISQCNDLTCLCLM